MAVEIKYVVVRKGEEKMIFASKKEADAYDKMLDMAEVFTDWLAAAPGELEEAQREGLGLFLAENKEAVQHILRTSKMPPNHESVTSVGSEPTPHKVSGEEEGKTKASRAGKAA